MTLHITVYSKPGCHLCEDALALLSTLRGEFQITINEIDIERDAALLKEYFDKIPVLIVGNHAPLTAPIRIQEVRAMLEQARSSVQGRA